MIKEGDLEERAFGLSLEALVWGRRVCLLDEEMGYTSRGALPGSASHVLDSTKQRQAWLLY